MDDALSELARAVQANPADVDARRALASAQARAGDGTSAYFTLARGGFDQDPRALELAPAVAKAQLEALGDLPDRFTIYGMFYGERDPRERASASLGRRPMHGIKVSDDHYGRKLQHDDMLAVASVPGLTSVVLSSYDLSDALIDPLADLADLESLFAYAHGGSLTARGLARLADGPCAGSLRELSLHRSKHLRGPELAALGQFQRLTSLKVDRCAWDDEDLACLAQVEGLVDLHLEEGEMGRAGLEPIAASAGLERLTLRSMHAAAGALADLRPLRALRELNVSGAGIGGKAFAHWPDSPVERLDFGIMGSLDPEGAVCVAALPGLRELDIRAGFNPDGVCKALVRSQSIEKLKIGVGRTGWEDGIVHLAKMPALKELELVAPAIRPERIKHFELFRDSGLKLLILSSCTKNVPEKEIQAATRGLRVEVRKKR